MRRIMGSNRTTIVLVIALAAVITITVLRAIHPWNTADPYGKIAAATAGTSVVSCAPGSPARADVRGILPYYRAGGPEGTPNLWREETALAGRFGNVSNLDEPRNLADAEVNYELAVSGAQVGGSGPGQPFDAGIATMIHALAAACGVIEAAGGIGP